MRSCFLFLPFLLKETVLLKGGFPLQYYCPIDPVSTPLLRKLMHYPAKHEMFVF